MERDSSGRAAMVEGGAAMGEGGSLGTYVTGFVLSVALTAIPFGLVMEGAASGAALVLAIFGAGLAQVMVHLYCFLHLNASSGARWNVLALVFAALVMVLVVGGTIWIMYNLSYRLG